MEKQQGKTSLNKLAKHKHIVNVKTVKGVKIITTMEGYKDLLIYPPSALLGDDENYGIALIVFFIVKIYSV